MSEALNALKEQIAADEETRARFAPGAPDEAIAPLRAAYPAVPEELLALLRWANGNARAEYAPETYEVLRTEQVLFESGSGLKLLSCDRILSTAQMWNEFAAEFRTMTPEEREERSHFGFWREDFIPFADSDRACVVIAIEPCFGGPPGQVISFDFKAGVGWTIEHDSFEGWLRLTTALLALDRELAKAQMPDTFLVRTTRRAELERQLAPERGSVDMPVPATTDAGRFALPKQRVCG